MGIRFWGIRQITSPSDIWTYHWRRPRGRRTVPTSPWCLRPVLMRTLTPGPIDSLDDDEPGVVWFVSLRGVWITSCSNSSVRAAISDTIWRARRAAGGVEGLTERLRAMVLVVSGRAIQHSAVRRFIAASVDEHACTVPVCYCEMKFRRKILCIMRINETIILTAWCAYSANNS